MKCNNFLCDQHRLVQAGFKCTKMKSCYARKRYNRITKRVRNETTYTNDTYIGVKLAEERNIYHGRK